MSRRRNRNKIDKNAGLSHGISGGCGVVPVELDEVVEGDEDAHQVHQDPKEVQDVVPIRALHQVKNFEKMSELKPGRVDRRVPWVGGSRLLPLFRRGRLDQGSK